MVGRPASESTNPRSTIWENPNSRSNPLQELSSGLFRRISHTCFLAKAIYMRLQSIALPLRSPWADPHPRRPRRDDISSCSPRTVVRGQAMRHAKCPSLFCIERGRFSCALCEQEGMVWWFPILLACLSEPIEKLLTGPLHRRSIIADVPVTVAAVSSARYYLSSRAQELTQSPSLLRRTLSRNAPLLGYGSFGTGVLMMTVRSRVLLPFLAPILVPTVCCVLAPNPIQAGENPSFLLATAAPTERLAPPVTWLDDLVSRLTTYFTKKYPAYDFTPYAQELDRIRDAAKVGDRWGAKREMGVFLNMLASCAYGLGDDAAEELALLAQQIMPDQEFGIIYPRSESEPPTEGGRT